MKSLVIIPARGGSKGIPHKNIKEFNGKPLIHYAIDCAREIVDDGDICVTTDDDEIIKVVEGYGLKVPFKRPAYLATDTCGTYEVLLHALNHFEQVGVRYDIIILLQCTSPFRNAQHVRNALKLYDKESDMVVSVTEAKANPYYNCFEESGDGYLKISKGSGDIHRRQDCPKAWEYNGAIYIINPESLKKESISKFRKVLKYEMDALHSIDLDTPLDWEIAEMIATKKLI